MDTYRRTADWSTSQSVDKANAFVVAARKYLITVPEQSSQPGGFSLRFSLIQIKAMLDEANQWLADCVNALPSSGPSAVGVSIMGAAHGRR
jgi:hypothetical protein